MKKAQKARGTYRAIYDSIDDDRDWRRLSPLAKCVFETLKRQLGQWGIDLLGLEVLPRIVNCTLAEIEQAVAELEAPKPGRTYGWIRREDEVIWIVNGLRFDPTLFVENNANHRQAAVRHARELQNLTRSHVVDEFVAYYGLESKLPDPIPHPIPDPIPHPIHESGGIQESESESEKESEKESESETENRERKREYAALPIDVIKFGALYYGRAPAPRRRKIAEQLLALARGDAVRYKRQDVVAGGPERLARLCREVMQGGELRDPDSAIAVLLVKLGDSSDVSAKQLKQERADFETEQRRAAADLAAAVAWEAENPAAAAAIDEALEREAPTGDDPLAAISRSVIRRTLLLDAWRRSGPLTLIRAAGGR